MNQVAVQEPWTPENWQARHKAIRARLMNAPVKKPNIIELKLVEIRRNTDNDASIYPAPIGPRWYTEMYESPIGPRRPVRHDVVSVASAESKSEFVPESFDDMNPRQIIRYFCRWHKVSEGALCGPQRIGEFMKVRLELYYVTRSLGHYSLPEIGRLIGGRDHTTILHGANKWARLLSEGKANPTPFDPELAHACCQGTLPVIRKPEYGAARHRNGITKKRA